MKLRNDAPVKYQIHAHRLCSSYPDELDIVYDIICFIQAGNKRKKSWKADDMKLGVELIKDVFPDIVDGEFKDKIKTILSELHNTNMIRQVEGGIQIAPEALAKLYIL